MYDLGFSKYFGSFNKISFMSHSSKIKLLSTGVDFLLR